MSNNELKEYQVGTTTMPLADMSKINQGMGGSVLQKSIRLF